MKNFDRPSVKIAHITYKKVNNLLKLKKNNFVTIQFMNLWGCLEMGPILDLNQELREKYGN